ncbi:hypothetical protein F5Y08DRAFT_32118 [Xylaria arbuscula]|nr:hypothetical protein F5Y08DRAFT_32118 [Xylaria arbuscula]
MELYSMPNWIRILLLILSSLTFLPQILALIHRRDTSGISIYYVLFNLIVSTELFAISFLLITDPTDGTGYFVHDPPDTGDWLNVGQFATICSLWLLIFILYVAFSPRERCWRNAVVLALYTSYLLISVIPVLLNAVSPIDPPGELPWFRALWLGVHALFLAPLITLLAVSTLPLQVRAILALPRGLGTGALSLSFLAAQAVIFLVLAVTWWPGRLVFPEGFGAPFRYFDVWYTSIGFVPIDYAIHALVQVILFFAAIWWCSNRPRATESPDARDNETDPLLPTR